MICPFCETENRDERDTCYHCGKDLSMLRLIVNKAKHHYNVALEHAERGRDNEAVVELLNSIDLDGHHIPARVVLGTLYARQEKLDQAREEWEKALQLNPSLAKAHDYLIKGIKFKRTLPILRTYRRMLFVTGTLLVLVCVCFAWYAAAGPTAAMLRRATGEYQHGEWAAAQLDLKNILARSWGRGNLVTSAQALQNGIADSFQLRMKLADSALRGGDFANALQTVAFFSNIQLLDDQKGQVERLRQLVTERAKTETDQMLQVYKDTGQGLPKLEDRLNRLEDASKRAGLTGIDVQQLRDEVDAARRTNENDELALMRADYLETKNDDAALIRAFRLVQDEKDKVSTEARHFYNTLLKNVSGHLQSQWLELVEAHQFDQARKISQEGLGVFPEKLRAEILHTIPSVDSMIQQAQARDYLAQLNQLARKQSYDEFLTLAQKKKQYTLAPALAADIETTVTVFQKALVQQDFQQLKEQMTKRDWEMAQKTAKQLQGRPLNDQQKKEVDTMLAEARHNDAEALLVSLKKYDVRFSTPPGKRVPKDLARKLIDQWDAVQALAPKNGPELRQLNFYHAAAAYLIGDNDDAASLFKDFLSTYKTGAYVEAAKKYQGLIPQNSSSPDDSASQDDWGE